MNAPRSRFVSSIDYFRIDYFTDGFNSVGRSEFYYILFAHAITIQESRRVIRLIVAMNPKQPFNTRLKTNDNKSVICPC